KPALKIRRMKTRWGSLSGSGAMTLHLELLKAPGGGSHNPGRQPGYEPPLSGASGSGSAGPGRR
ncbi:MAG: M48 family metallopeptidase, partial [Gammaproteobacteria bacterium]|nr:M48 family metallopeptidase [Gammaproteobacteria bacterium]